MPLPSSRGVRARRSKEYRNAASVLPLPVGALMSVCSPVAIAGHACSCTAVGSANARANHSCVWGLKAESGTGPSGYDARQARRSRIVYPATSRAVRRTSSSMASVSTPVNVFCWLGW